MEEKVKKSVLSSNKIEELARPLLDHLKENCHPYTCIVITGERVAVLETVISIPENLIV